MTRHFYRSLALLASTIILAVGAQTPAATDMIPAPTCEQPHYPGRTAAEKQMERFNKSLTAYAKCMNEYVAGQTNVAKGLQADEVGLVDELNALEKKKLELKNKVILVQDKQKRHVEARNLAVNELNSYLTRVKKESGQ